MIRVEMTSLWCKGFTRIDQLSQRDNSEGYDDNSVRFFSGKKHNTLEDLMGVFDMLI